MLFFFPSVNEQFVLNLVDVLRTICVYVFYVFPIYVVIFKIEIQYEMFLVGYSRGFPEILRQEKYVIYCTYSICALIHVTAGTA